MDNIERKARSLEAEYHRNWRAKNPDKVKAINKRYWIKKAQQESEKMQSSTQI